MDDEQVMENRRANTRLHRRKYALEKAIDAGTPPIDLVPISKRIEAYVFEGQSDEQDGRAPAV